MGHFVCKGGCGGKKEEVGVCEGEGCSNQWEMMEECECEDGEHGAGGEAEAAVITKDSNGTVLADGDDVVLIKDLPLRGTSRVYKRGTKVTGIKLTGNADEVDCKIAGSSIVLRTEFLKKL
jgi:protein PhnA